MTLTEWESKGWLHRIDGKFKPKIFIATQEDGDTLYEYAKPVSKKIVKQIREQLPGIKEKFRQTELSKKQSSSQI